MTKHPLSKALDHHRAGRLQEAERLYRAALAKRPGDADALRLLAVVKHQTGRNQEALADLDGLLADRPLYPEAQANRAVVLAALGRVAEAEAGFRQILDIVPGFPDAFGPLVRLLLAQERLDEAGALLAQVKDGWHLERAALAQKSGRPDLALSVLEAGLAQAPGQAPLLAALVPVLTSLGRHGQAIEAGRAALALSPNLLGVQHNLALALLDAGDLRAGWQAFAGRWQAPGFPSHPRKLNAPQWDGKSDLRGKTVLVWREQGVGDEISFASALPDLIERAGQVVVDCSPKLAELFARSFPKALVRAEDRARDPDCPGIDLHLPMGDLFPAFRPSLASFAQAPYLLADPTKRRHWRDRLEGLGPEPKIGIAWKSTLVTPSRAPTFLPSLLDMQALLTVPGVVFVNLQPKADKAEIEQARRQTGAVIHCFDDLDLFDDLDGSAALMAELDKVAAIGTATAVLAAALGAPTGMFLLSHAQWDPMGGDKIPWLPSAVLFRRNWNESWDNAVQSAAIWIGGGTTTATTPAPTPGPVASASGAETLLDQATAAHLAGDKAKAQALYRAALERNPEQVEALVNLAAILDEAGQPQEALPLLQTAFKLRPNEAAISDNLGRLLIRLDRLEEAAPVLEQALKQEPDNVGLMNDLGNALRLLNRLDDSLVWLERAHKIAPQALPVRFNLAKSLRELGRCEEALAHLRAVPNPDRDTLWEIGATCLQMGDLAQGWPLIENRPLGWRGPAPDFKGRTVLVRAEQGVGDYLIYGQALPDLADQAKQVVLEAPLKLHALLGRSLPELSLIAPGQPLPACDLSLSLGSLFHFFRPSLASFGNAPAFLKADPDKAAAWRQRLDALGPSFKLGLAWRSTLVTRERARHFPGHPARLRPLFALQDAVFINLQAQATADELQGLAAFPLLDLFEDLDETAALIDALDAVAANGSAIAMLSGALGKPTAILMRAHASWDRLGTDRLPWLGSAKLFDCAWNEPWESAARQAADWISAKAHQKDVIGHG